MYKAQEIRTLLKCEEGQSTVEAAFVIPTLFVLFILLLQPGIFLYNLMVMESAAGEACRLLATKPNEGDFSSEAYEEYILRRLGSIPPQEVFHVHKGGCSWNITLHGDEGSETVSVEISHLVKPLPLLDAGAKLLGISNTQGYIEQKVARSTSTQPSWIVTSDLGLDPKGWVEQWI